MGGSVIEAIFDQYQEILDFLAKAAKPDIKKIAGFAASELHDISNTAFEQEADPVTGEKWKKLKSPRSDGTTTSILRHHSTLYGSLTDQGFADGRAVLGSNMVYARIHQEGGKTAAHDIRPVQGRALRFNGRFASRVHHPGSTIPARPYMGIPKDIDRRILNDPYILDLLNMRTT
jgi:phage virion morphogenesis protein